MTSTTQIVEQLPAEYQGFKELLVVADKYDVPSLVDVCAGKIEDGLTVENVLDTGMFARFAETHNSDVLMEKCAKFIAASKGTTLTGDWMKKVGKSPKLAARIIKELKSHKLITISRVPSKLVTFGGPSD